MEPKELRAVVAKNIRRVAKRRKLSLNMLADRAGIGRSPFFHALAGKSSFTIDRLCKLADALECNPREFFADERPAS